MSFDCELAFCNRIQTNQSTIRQLIDDPQSWLIASASNTVNWEIIGWALFWLNWLTDGSAKIKPSQNFSTIEILGKSVKNPKKFTTYKKIQDIFAVLAINFVTHIATIESDRI